MVTGRRGACSEKVGPVRSILSFELKRIRNQCTIPNVTSAKGHFIFLNRLEDPILKKKKKRTIHRH